MYEFVAIPILSDRYIIFVLIPIILLISILLYQIENKYLKNSLVLILLISTSINLFFEIKFREETKPEFNHAIEYISESKTKNLAIFVDNQKVDRETLLIINNYMFSLGVSKINNIWIVCFEPVTGIHCKDYKIKNKKWDLVEEKKYHLLSVNLVRRKN